MTTENQDRTPLEILILRHGETEYNEKGILQGQLDTALNQLGREQAAAAGDALRGVHFQACYAGDLSRTMDTARIALHNAGAQVEITPEPALREWNLGIFQNRRHQELHQEYPELMAAFKEECGDLQIPGGESRFQFAERIRECLVATARRHRPGERILLVTHGGAMQMIFRTVIGPVTTGNVTPLASNASISKIRYFHYLDRFQLVTWNNTAHLDKIGSHATLTY